MSRRRGEFEHRTSIFEGAFRAWSHLGGLEPEDLESKPASDLDPLTNPIESDSRLKGNKGGEAREGSTNPDGSKRREYPYEPLPRSGLAHPYVQAILSPWLGPDADNDAIQLGLTTLRTWWQHRRKGESGSAVAALGTEKMRGVVEGYTRHFFTLAHCLVMNDKEQPPRSLHAKMKELEKIRSKRNKKRAREEEAGKIHLMAMAPSGGAPTDDPKSVAARVAADLTDANLTPLERLHAAQRRQLAVEGGVHTPMQQGGGADSNGVSGGNGGGGAAPGIPPAPIINIKNKCMPGTDLQPVVDAVSAAASQLAHRGVKATPVSSGATPAAVPSSVTSGSTATNYGDPDTAPIVFVGENGEIMLAMVVDGITCAHCVKIVETVLKGCNGNKSPIDGLLDAASDRVLCSVLIKIDKISNAKRIAFESARNLAMVGYTAKAKDMSISVERDGKKSVMDMDTVNAAFDAVCRVDPKQIFDWTIPCTCPDNGVLREDCGRHSQMSTQIFESFDERGRLATQYMSGAKLEPRERTSQSQQIHQHAQGQHMHQQMQQHQPQHAQQMMNEHFPQAIMGGDGPSMGAVHAQGMGQNPGIDFFGGGSGMNPMQNNPHQLNDGDMMQQRNAQRNPSIISFGGNGLRHMSFTSEATFGRAMSGLSALSIDWENMDDFDINVDHSSHINNSSSPAGRMQSNDGMLEPQPLGGGPGGRRSSLRRSFVASDQDAHVSFKV